MLSLAAFRYRNVLKSDGGPIARIAVREFPVYGRRMYQANAWLADGVIPERRKFALYSDADGTGAADVPMVARYMAISEAMERWAFHVKVRADDRELYGFDLDESSNGMAAFPGMFPSQARKRAMLEAVERASVLAWWEGLLDGEVRPTEWPGISALVLPSPIGYGVTVLAFREVRPDTFAYGHGAATDFFGACERAVMELARHEYVLGLHRLSRGVTAEAAPSDLFERRALFFSSAEGHALFQARLQRKTTGRRFVARVAYDTELRGPWSDYAAVWRVLIDPPSRDFLADTERYFFW
ncbi:YcaO-like family protein [Opitutus terrae]|uniref:Uncharacterized protein n=1 Tax=Opitutus terrae (strain DSM 11246 / JCM 15787 / PB90-1) TaxID=452637 RepID=B1ZP32_OPITP|nr:YcaO-like family protein [Opitutus terrae]ACB77518.1 hypothetical protein Oter_4245 [Opitutus terrae PB90-1]